MAIPALTSAGLLPAGVHAATLQEIRDVFGRDTPRRVELFAKLTTFVELARSFQLFASCIVDGSFVTDKAAPGDIDVVLVIPRRRIKQLLVHPRFTQISDGRRIQRTYEVHLFIQPPPSGMADFFQSLRPDEALRRNVRIDQRRGILEVAL